MLKKIKENIYFNNMTQEKQWDREWKRIDFNKTVIINLNKDKIKIKFQLKIKLLCRLLPRLI